jgi:hypothetical protein
MDWNLGKLLLQLLGMPLKSSKKILIKGNFNLQLVV